MKIHEQSCYELEISLRNKQISSVELVKHYLDRIEKYDNEIGSFVFVNRDKALQEAKYSDDLRAKNEVRGPLEGIPIAIKDNICTKGIPTTCSSKVLQNFVPPYDAHVIEKLKNAGAIILGKTNMDEFAMGSSCENSSKGVTKNPWNLKCIPGGSSGGSAAAVAAGLSPIALGSDTGGSVRQPAAMCGVMGLKPTYGRVSRFGLVAYGSSLDQIGPITRDIRDTALLLQTIAGKDYRDATSNNVAVTNFLQKEYSLKGKKIGVPKKYLEQLDGDIAKNIQDKLQYLQEQGIEIKDIDLPHFQYAIPAYYIIATAEASSNLARYDGVRYGERTDSYQNLEELYVKSRSNGFGVEVKRRILLGTYVLSSGYYDAYYNKALKVRTLIKNDMEKALQEVDFIATPTSPITAFSLGEKVSDPLSMYLCDIFTVTTNLAGNPAISIPCGMSSANLPIGLQITGKIYDEENLLSMVYKIDNNKAALAKGFE